MLSSYALLLLVGIGRKVGGKSVLGRSAEWARLAGLQVLAVGVEVSQRLLGTQLALVAIEQAPAVSLALLKVRVSGFGSGERGRSLLMLLSQGVGAASVVVGRLRQG